MDNKPKDKVEVTHCPPGYAIGYQTDSHHYESLRTEGISSSEISNFARLWVAVIREHLNDLRLTPSGGEQSRQITESFNWLFRDKRTFPAVATLLGYEYRSFRKSLIKFVRLQKAQRDFEIAIKIYYVNLNQQTEKIMTTLENLTYTELQKLAKEKGLNCKAMKKPELITLLQEAAIEDLKAANPAPVSPKAVKSKIITDVDEIYQAAPTILKVDMETQKIVDHCNEIFSNSIYPNAKARASKTGNGIDFLGGPRESQWVTLDQKAATIYYFAKVFVNKAVIEKTKTGENGETTFISEIR